MTSDGVFSISLQPLALCHHFKCQSSLKIPYCSCSLLNLFSSPTIHYLVMSRLLYLNLICPNILNSFWNFPGSGPRSISSLTHLYQTLFNYILKYCGLWILHFHSPLSTRWVSSSHLVFMLEIPSIDSLLHPHISILLFWKVLQLQSLFSLILCRTLITIFIMS